MIFFTVWVSNSVLQWLNSHLLWFSHRGWTDPLQQITTTVPSAGPTRSSLICKGQFIQLCRILFSIAFSSPLVHLLLKEKNVSCLHINTVEQLIQVTQSSTKRNQAIWRFFKREIEQLILGWATLRASAGEEGIGNFPLKSQPLDLFFLWHCRLLWSSLAQIAKDPWRNYIYFCRGDRSMGKGRSTSICSSSWNQYWRRHVPHMYQTLFSRHSLLIALLGVSFLPNLVFKWPPWDSIERADL